MRSIALAFGFAMLACAGDRAVAADRTACLSGWETQERVAAGRAVPPAAAILEARKAVPQSDIMRASLCPTPGGLIYLLLALRGDGRLFYVTIDGASGKVVGLR